MTAQRPAHIAHIDGMRALAVLAVMLYHLAPALLPGGFVGVDVFFVISGFVVTASLANHGHERPGAFLANFYARRLARLIPALVTMLVITTLAYVLLVPKAWFNRAAESVGQAAFWGLSNWVLDRHTVNYFEPRAELNPFTHTWSLGVEEQFYLIAPLLLYIALRRPTARRHRLAAMLTIATLAALSLLACYYVGVTQGGRAVFYLLTYRFWELAAGVLMFLLLPRIRRLWAGIDAAGRLSGAAGLLLIGTAMLIPMSAAYPYVRASAAVLGGMLLIGSAHAQPSDAVRRLLAGRWARWVGERSYALYLWHWPVYVLARWTVGLAAWPFNFAAVAFSFLLAALSYRFIEQPFRTSVRLRARAPAVRIALCLLIMAGGWLAGRTLLDLQPRLGLGQVTRQAADWYGDRLLLKRTRAAYRQCEPVTVPVDIGPLKGAGTRYEPRDCPQRVPSRLFVVGDSHAMAYRPMLEQWSAEEGRTVILLPTPGCSYLDLKEVLDERHDPACFRVARDAMTVVLDQARPGDWVLLSSLRLPRLVELGGRRRTAADPFALTAAERDGLARAREDAPRWIVPFLAAGLKVVLEAPKPVFRAHPFACVEWWQRRNPECAAPLEERRADLERYRAPVMDALRALADEHPGVRLWDPLPSLCDGTTCAALRAGRPLFFDADHLSPYGNLVLLPSFRAFLQHMEPSRAHERPRQPAPGPL
jgi:peptidoglycan/LPS O-acetylase OafA/YrhL